MEDFRAFPRWMIALLVAQMLQIVSSEHTQAAIRRGDVKVHGVNLGGWLVAEYWMTYDSPIWAGVPDDIRIKGEFYTMSFLGHEKGDERFERHRAEWITASDIHEIASRGLNTVRVPVGYWITGRDDAYESGLQSLRDKPWTVFAPGALKYLDALINDWAAGSNVAVLISLHGHKGSQNGRDHSATATYNDPQWSSSPHNVDNSVELALFLARRYARSPAFLGLSLMNEPEFPTSPAVVQSFYQRVHQQLRAEGNDCVLVLSPMLSQQRVPFMMDFLKGAPNVWLDWHPYYKWGYEGRREPDLIAAAQAYGPVVAQWTGNPLLISEWSLGVWDVFAPFHDQELLGRFGQTQLASFQGARAGWLFWSWRHADDVHPMVHCGWSLRSLLRRSQLVI